MSVGDLPGKSLTDADDNILGVYQDWVHQNPGTHLDGKIEEDSKWQELWKNWLLFSPTSGRIGNLFVGIITIGI